ncbi:hypothetical protein H4R34_003628 [Dimargaris verticillata]|uniref:Uncharacterized protein n=1 Tax=Dimargaris verticillata TaxID=2761393 RepID=A0A9W8B753_9FUNG|nr:hypothetical protein H4R34_003628 [Dimargaris verticillata]
MKVLMTFAILQATLPAWLALANTEATTHQLAHLERRTESELQSVGQAPGEEQIYRQSKPMDVEDVNPKDGSIARMQEAQPRDSDSSTSDDDSKQFRQNPNEQPLNRRQVKVPGEYDSLERRAPTFANQVAMHKLQVERNAALH